MFITKLSTRYIKIPLLSMLIVSAFTLSIQAKVFNAYPGKYKATLISVETANVIYLMVEVWEGFPRKFKITLADITVPTANSESPACQIELVKQAYAFSNSFLNKAKDIKVFDIYMDGTDKEEGKSRVKTENGQLASALMGEGLARSASIDEDTPWCEDAVAPTGNSDFIETVSVVPSQQKTTTGFMQEITEKRVYTGAARSGKQVYEFRCKGCHGKNTQGAPMPNDKFDWTQRLNKGIDMLMEHAVDGYSNYLMPPMGGCRNCTEKEVHRAVVYMLETSGIRLAEAN